MNGALDRDWQSLSATKPKLTSRLAVTYQTFRQSRWYILRNESTGEFCRFNNTAYQFIANLDGKASLEAILQRQDTAEQSSISPEEAVSILNKLRAMGFLHSDESISAAAGVELQSGSKQQPLLSMFKNPLGIRIPLARPNNFLNAMSPWSKVIFSTPFLLVYFFTVSAATLIAYVHSADITETLNDNFLRPSNLVGMFLSFVLIKILHELSHAIFVKNWGGEIGECGISLLFFTPLPYVDASSAWQFREKRKRILSSAAGILAELLVAACCVIIWYFAESQHIRALSLSMAVVASVSTVMFNANPLLKFDGYFILQDLIEIPNLYSRSKTYCLFLMKKYVLGDNSLPAPQTEAGETAWLIGFGILSFFYRLFILFVIIIYLTKTFLILGLLLALLTAYQQFIKPLSQAASYLVRQSKNGHLNARHSTCSLALLLILMAVFVAAPLPKHTNATGVVWLDAQTQIYSGSDAFIAVSHAQPGDLVSQGDLLITLESPDLSANIARLEAKIRELRLNKAEQYISKKGRHDTIQQSISAFEKELLILHTDRQNLSLHAKTPGIFMSPQRKHIAGSFVRRGELLAYVFSTDHLIVQAVIPQQKMGLARGDIKHVEVRLDNDLDKAVLASIKRIQPRGKNSLPNKALGTLGGGQIPVDPHASSTTETEALFFHIDLALTNAEHIESLGGLVHVRITHDDTPLLGRALRKIKHVFLTTVNYV